MLISQHNKNACSKETLPTHYHMSDVRVGFRVMLPPVTTSLTSHTWAQMPGDTTPTFLLGGRTLMLLSPHLLQDTKSIFCIQV